MYSFFENYAGGYFTSLGKKYPFVATPDGSDKRRAQREMEADRARTYADLSARLGRSPTAREMAQGVSPGDTRPLRQRVAEDGSVTTRKPATGNPYSSRIAQLEAAVCRTPAERAARDRRLAQARTSEAAWEQQQARAAEAAKRRESIADDILDAQTSVTLTRYGAGYTPDDVRIAERLLSDLEASGDVAAYRSARDAWEQSIMDRREAAAKALEAQSAEQRRLAEMIRRGESPDQPQGDQ